MANKIFRPFPIYFNSKKIAEIMSGTYDHTNGNADQVTIEGVAGQSRGAQESKVDFDTVCPVAGHEIDFSSAMLDEATITIGIAVDGGYDAVEGTLTGRSYSMDAKSGECKGKWSFIGGKPTRVAA